MEMWKNMLVKKEEQSTPDLKIKEEELSTPNLLYPSVTHPLIQTILWTGGT